MTAGPGSKPYIETFATNRLRVERKVWSTTPVLFGKRLAHQKSLRIQPQPASERRVASIGLSTKKSV